MIAVEGTTTQGLLALIGVMVTTGGAVAVAMLTNRVRRDQQTGNGHTIGQGVARSESQLVEVLSRLDGLDVNLREVRFWLQRHEAQYHHTYRVDWDDPGVDIGSMPLTTTEEDETE